MNPDLPPPNRAIGWYRFMLWMMPTCIAVTTVFGFGWIESVVRVPSGLLRDGWFVFNLLAAVGIGCFDAKLGDSQSGASRPTRTRVVRFVLLQCLIVPSLCFALLCAACLFAGY